MNGMMGADGGTSVPFSGRLRVALSLGAAAILLALAVPVQAADKTLVDKGEVLLRDNCSRCHAIRKTGESPHPPAPPFRTLSRKYPVEDLAESLAEGIVSGHPDMPIFMFSPTDVEAIIQYLQSIQEQ
jgi:cytochrome c